MIVKIATIGLMAFIATSRGKEVWDGYSAKWDQNAVDSFYTLPQSLRDAESQGWTEVSGAGVSHSVKPMCYRGDPRVVILFSKCSGKVLGHQVGFPVADMKNVPINYDANPGITRKTLNGKEYYTGTALYRKNERRNTRELWLEVGGKFEKIPTKPELITRNTPYYLKRCITWMGVHYYRINSSTDCGSIFPWALLRLEDDIVGLTFQVIGNSTSAPGRTWFEYLPVENVAYTIPDAPACIGEGIIKYGLTSFHVWFRKDPLATVCRDDCTAVVNSTGGRNQPYYHAAKRYKRALGSGNICPV